MKCNKFLLVIVLCVGMQPMASLGAQKSYWESYAPQSLQNLWNTVNNWSLKKKIAVASATIGALAVIYNRDQILQWVGELVRQSQVDNQSSWRLNAEQIAEKKQELEKLSKEITPLIKQYFDATEEQGKKISKEIYSSGLAQKIDDIVGSEGFSGDRPLLYYLYKLFESKGFSRYDIEAIFDDILILHW